MQTTTDLYKLLGLPREASQDDIRKAHRNLVRKHHPDANPGDSSSEERFKEIQRAYEVLSDPEKKREYDRKRRASSKGASRRTRASAGRRTESAAPPVDLSDLLRKLTDLSSERSDGHKEGNFQLRGEEIARLAKLLGVDTSRISKLLGKDITRLSKLIAESIRVNTQVNPGDGRSGRYQSTGERLSGGKRSGGSNGPREKKVKGPKARRKEKRVRGPRAQRRKQNP